MNKFLDLLRRQYKKVVAALALGFAAVVPAVARAEGESVTGFDTSFVTSFLNKVSATITSFWNDNQTSLMVILGVIAVFALLWLAVRLFKRSTSRA